MAYTRFVVVFSCFWLTSSVCIFLTSDPLASPFCGPRLRPFRPRIPRHENRREEPKRGLTPLKRPVSQINPSSPNQEPHATISCGPLCLLLPASLLRGTKSFTY